MFGKNHPFAGVFILTIYPKTFHDISVKFKSENILFRWIYLVYLKKANKSYGQEQKLFSVRHNCENASISCYPHKLENQTLSTYYLSKNSHFGGYQIYARLFKLGGLGVAPTFA